MDSPVDRRARYDLAHLGDAIGEPSRAAMLVALMGGARRPASELARIAGVAPSTAAAHLRRLEDAGLVVVRAEGRHRYYALAGPEVAHAVESLATCARGSSRRSASLDPLAVARTCYGHLAGRLAVAFWSRAKAERWVRWSDVAVTLVPRGRDVLAQCELLRTTGAPLLGQPCLDWSERVPHVAGPLGIAICKAFLDARWVARADEGRCLRVTAMGHERLRALGVAWLPGNLAMPRPPA